ncbi:MAG: hypothetical protein IPM59_09610 [Chloracidobacterium sp.]|nr:hypothetical protein [Chloracidobacterium sp.]
MTEAEFTRGQIRPIECLKEAWERIKPDYWMLFAISIVGALIGGISMYVLIGAMICGIFHSYLKVLDGEGKPSIDDLWVGFKFFWPSLLVTALIVIPIVVYILALFVTMYLPLIMKAAGGSRVSDEEMIGSVLMVLAVDIVIALVMVTIHSLLIFSYPLIVDRGLSSWDAIKLSARATLKNVSGVGGLIVVNFCIAIAGYLAFCIGLYLAIPLMTATNIVAYRRVFPKTQ